MPIPPVVGQAFKTASGLKASILFDLQPPDSQGRAFAGKVQTNGTFQYSYWRANGVNQDATLNLESLWPTNSPARYMPIMPTPHGAFRIMGQLYQDLNTLKAEWIPKGCVWAVTIDRDGSNNPTVARTALT